MILTVAQEKGGVGKTTTAKNVAVAASLSGSRVLLIDTDPQFAATRQLGIHAHELPLTLVEVLANGADARSAVVVGHHGIDVLPGARRLRDVELALAGEMGRETFLRSAIETLREDYDLIVIDTPPNLGLLTVNALLPADVVLAPVSAEDEGAAQGTVELRATLDKLGRLREGPGPRLIAVMTKWRPDRIMAAVVEEAVVGQGVTIAGRIPSQAIVQQSSASRLPVVLAAPASAAALAYIALTADLLDLVESR